MAKTFGPTEPSRPTVKRLYALTGNRCAFYDCPTRLVDKATGSVVGQVCHIKGEKPSAPRYDSTQTDLERHGFDNLIVLCNIHHKVIDDNWQTYPIDRLLKMKADHESRLEGKEPIDEEVSDLFSSAPSIFVVQHGSVIHTANQTGGQVAHSITNNYYDLPKHVTSPMGLNRSMPGNNPPLSEQAITLLRQAAEGDGSIMVIKADAGLAILADHRQVNEMGNARSEALYRQIVETLRTSALITQTDSYKGVVVYKITQAAFELVDAMK